MSQQWAVDHGFRIVREPKTTGPMPTEAFLPLFGQDYEHFALFGGRGAAKSHFVGEALVAHASAGPERIVCGRQFQTSIKDSVKELLEQKIHKMGMAALFTSTDREIVNVSTGSRFTFIGMDRNPDSAKSLEGTTIFWGEEAQSFTRRAVEVILPTIRHRRARFYWTWNPRFRTDPVDDMFRGSVAPARSYVKQVSWRDNPYFLRTRLKSEYDRSLAKNPKRHLHIWEGGYDENPDVAVFDNWRIGRIEVPDKVPPRYGMDFGFSHDPNALVKLYILEDLGVIYIAEEAYAHKVPNRQLPDFMDGVTGVRDHPVTADSARPETIDYLNSCGFSVFGARKGAGSVKNGITWLQGYEVVISPDCPNVAEEWRSYCWATDANGKPLSYPAEKQQDHGIDAVRYAAEDASIQAGQSDGGVDYV
jgi:phage terminase large subunit